MGVEAIQNMALSWRPAAGPQATVQNDVWRVHTSRLLCLGHSPVWGY